jgi:hypothetical protein
MEKQEITVLEGLFRSCRDAKLCVSTGGLKARKSLDRGNAPGYGRLSTPEAPAGRNLSVRITPLQGLAFAGHSFRRALPCAVDDRTFSPFSVLPFSRSSVHPFSHSSVHPFFPSPFPKL